MSVKQWVCLIFAIVILSFVVTHCPVYAADDWFEGWSDSDKALFGLLNTMLTVDYLQTREIYKDDETREINPIIRNVFPGEYSFFYFVLCAGAAYHIADVLPEGWRKGFLIGVSALEIGVAAHNYSIGIRIDF